MRPKKKRAAPSEQMQCGASEGEQLQCGASETHRIVAAILDCDSDVEEASKTHRIVAAILDSDSDVDEAMLRVWVPRKNVAPVASPAFAIGGQSSRPLAASGGQCDRPLAVARPVAGESVARTLAGKSLDDHYRERLKREREVETDAEDPWRLSKIWAKKALWPTWGKGVFDARESRRDGRRSCEGRVLQHCMTECDKIMKVKSIIKIGLLSNISNRWAMYVDAPPGRWQPKVLFLLATVDGRSAAAFLEAALINHVAAKYSGFSLNKIRGDRGGEGPPPRPESLFAPHSVYAAACPVRHG